MSQLVKTQETQEGDVTTAPVQPAERERRLRKNVGLIHSSGNLSFVERKLVNILLYEAYDNLKVKRTHTISMPILCAMLGWGSSHRIEHLKEALTSLQTTVVQFNLRQDGKEAWESMAMLSYAKVEGGVCSWRYDDAMIEKLHDPLIFALINMRMQGQVRSRYELNLYENLYRYKDANQGSTGEWELARLRQVIGATSSYYDDYRELNRKVLKPSIDKINRDTDISVRMETIRVARQVAAIKFFVTEKKNKSADLSGISVQDGVDASAGKRSTDAYQALMRHGISDRLALEWIEHVGVDHVLKVVLYTEQQDAVKPIKRSGAYITKLITERAVVGITEYESQKQVAKAMTDELQQQERKDARQKALLDEFLAEQKRLSEQAMSREQRLDMARRWVETEEGKKHAQELNTDLEDLFKDTITKVKFRIFTDKQQTHTKPFDQKEFDQWLDQKNIKRSLTTDIE